MSTEQLGEAYKRVTDLEVKCYNLEKELKEAKKQAIEFLGHGYAENKMSHLLHDMIGWCNIQTAFSEKFEKELEQEKAAHKATIQRCVDFISGHCQEHRHLSFDEFINQGGNACPLCQHIEIEKWKKEWADAQEGADIIFDTPQALRNFESMLKDDPK